MGVNMFLYNVFILVLSMSCKSNSAPSPGGEKPLEKRYKKIVLDDKYIVSGGHHTPHYLGATGAPYGFFVFTPTGYNETEEKFPLLVFSAWFRRNGEQPLGYSGIVSCNTARSTQDNTRGKVGSCTKDDSSFSSMP